MTGHSSGNRGDQQPACATLADRLNHLIDTVPVGGQTLTSEGLAKAVSAMGEGFHLSVDYVRKLRQGRMTNPSLRVVQGLARVFGVNPSYFTDDTPEAAELQEHLALAAALRDKGVRSLALRSSQLSPEGLQALTALVNALDDGADKHC